MGFEPTTFCLGIRVPVKSPRTTTCSMYLIGILLPVVFSALQHKMLSKASQ